MERNKWKIISEDEQQAAVDKYQAIKKTAMDMSEPQRIEYLNAEVEKFSKDELLAIIADEMSKHWR